MSPRPLSRSQVRWARVWMTVVLMGAFVFAIGLDPDLIGMDRSPVVGFVQVGVWLAGLGVIWIAAYAALRVIRNGLPKTLRSDIGLRLIATGYVLSAAASLADFIGLGAHRLPEVYFGPLQVVGLVIGMLISLAGTLLYLPGRRRQPPPSSPSD